MTWRRFAVHPLAAWVENTFGIDLQDGRLVRRMPIKFKEGVEQLTKQVVCRRVLRAEAQGSAGRGQRSKE